MIGGRPRTAGRATLCGLALATGIAACSDPRPQDPWRFLAHQDGVTARADPSAGPSPRAIPLVGPARPPDDPEGTVAVWVDLPADEVVPWVDGQPAWPVGTVLWRTVHTDDGHLAEAQGLERQDQGLRAHLVREADGVRGAVTWTLGTADTESLGRTLAYALPPWRDLRPAPLDEARTRLQARLRCEACHQPGLPAADRVLQRAEPTVAATDALGAFTPTSLWSDQAPIPAHGVRDPNVDAAHTTVTCPTGPVHRVPDAQGDLRLRCSLGAVAVLTHDLGAAQQAGDPWADARCASRNALSARLDAAGQAAVAPALAACGGSAAP